MISDAKKFALDKVTKQFFLAARIFFLAARHFFLTSRKNNCCTKDIVFLLPSRKKFFASDKISVSENPYEA